MSRSAAGVLIVVSLPFLLWALPAARAQSAGNNNSAPGGRRPIIYVMPNALSSPGAADNSQVVGDSSHNGKEPQVAKIY